ncbi:hypothetical protein [Streptacidiphilus melanogenes]|uniref:hypothetical protein n=1 Tax=Streptacidiphilus melanogenes TaxID=411235 RepID=UPI0005A746F5|nr:hypothetical protein [Streptacidiphilus melanogenes]
MTVVAVVAGVSALGVVAPATAQAAPRSVAVVQTDHHRHCDGDRDRDDWFCRCDRDRDREDRGCRHHHGVEAGGGGMAALVAARSSHLGA